MNLTEIFFVPSKKMTSAAKSLPVLQPLKVLFAPTDPDGKVRFKRFCKKATACDRGDECVFAHSYEQLNPVLCAHEGKGCKRTDCVFMHTWESKLSYVRRACMDDIRRLGIELPEGNAAEMSGKLKITSVTAVESIKSAYEELCEHAKHFRGPSWADMDDDDRTYAVDDNEWKLHQPDCTSKHDYEERTLFRLFGDGTLQANRGDGTFATVERCGVPVANVYDILGSCSSSSSTDRAKEKKAEKAEKGKKKSTKMKLDKNGRPKKLLSLEEKTS